MANFLFTCGLFAGTGDGGSQAGSGGGAETTRGPGKTTTGGDLQETETCGTGGEAQGETEITGANNKSR